MREFLNQFGRVVATLIICAGVLAAISLVTGDRPTMIDFVLLIAIQALWKVEAGR